MGGNDGEVTTVLQIEDMACVGCASAVEEALTGVDGVSAASVNLAERTAHVRHLPAVVGRDELVRVVRAAGYPVDG